MEKSSSAFRHIAGVLRNECVAKGTLAMGYMRLGGRLLPGNTLLQRLACVKSLVRQNAYESGAKP